MGLDPGTTRAGLHTAREVISGRQISYPVPYILVILCVLCLACLIVAAHSADATQTFCLSLLLGVCHSNCNLGICSRIQTRTA